MPLSPMFSCSFIRIFFLNLPVILNRWTVFLISQVLDYAASVFFLFLWFCDGWLTVMVNHFLFCYHFLFKTFDNELIFSGDIFFSVGGPCVLSYKQRIFASAPADNHRGSLVWNLLLLLFFEISLFFGWCKFRLHTYAIYKLRFWFLIGEQCYFSSSSLGREKPPCHLLGQWEDICYCCLCWLLSYSLSALTTLLYTLFCDARTGTLKTTSFLSHLPVFQHLPIGSLEWEWKTEGERRDHFLFAHYSWTFTFAMVHNPSDGDGFSL